MNKQPPKDSNEVELNDRVDAVANQKPRKSEIDSKGRRDAVRNIIAGGGVVGVAASTQWSKPIIDAVVLPAHAQTSADDSGPVTLIGNASLRSVVDNGQNHPSDILDFFIGSANARIAIPDPAGSCLTLVVDSTMFDLTIDFADTSRVNFTGSVSNNAFSGSDSGISVTGTVDLMASMPTASGQITDGSNTYTFALDDTQTSCSPIQVTTTPEPTTTSGTTTTTAPTE